MVQAAPGAASTSTCLVQAAAIGLASMLRVLNWASKSVPACLPASPPLAEYKVVQREQVANPGERLSSTAEHGGLLRCACWGVARGSHSLHLCTTTAALACQHQLACQMTLPLHSALASRPILLCSLLPAHADPCTLLPSGPPKLLVLVA